MKKIFCIILAVVSIVSVLVFSGCGNDTAVDSDKVQETTEVVKEEPAKEPIGMERIYGASGFVYYRDVTTDVMYLFFYGMKQAGLTVMMDPETNGPLTYEKWTEYQNDEPTISE